MKPKMTKRTEGKGFEQPNLVKEGSAHDRWVGLDDL